MSDTLNRQLVLITRPDANVGPEHFEMRRSTVPALEAGQALVRVHWLGIDATQRTWLNERETYTSPARIGSVMPGSGVGQVVASRSELFKVGDWVVGETGWQDYALAAGEGLHGFTRIPEGIEPRAMLSVFGVNGLTAYFGMTEIAKPLEGETVFVSAAAGGVGSIAGQIARKLGAKVLEFHKERPDEPTGKSIVLQKAFQALLGYEQNYDAVFFFDADNLVDLNMFSEVNSQFLDSDDWIVPEATITLGQAPLQFGRLASSRR